MQNPEPRALLYMCTIFLHLPAALYYMYVFDYRKQLLRKVIEGENCILNKSAVNFAVSLA